MDTGRSAAAPEYLDENWGHWIFVFDRGRFAITQENRTSCTWGYGTFSVDGDKTTWRFTRRRRRRAERRDEQAGRGVLLPAEPVPRHRHARPGQGRGLADELRRRAVAEARPAVAHAAEPALPAAGPGARALSGQPFSGAYSMTVLAMAGGSRPARSHPAAVAASGTPITARRGRGPARRLQIAEVVVVERQQERRRRRRRRAARRGARAPRRWWPSACGGCGRWLRSRSACAGHPRSRCGSVRPSCARMPSASSAPAAVVMAMALAGRRPLPLDLDREAGVRRALAGVRDLVARQRPARLDEPAGRDLLPAVAAKTVERDEDRRLASTPIAEPNRCRPMSILWTFVTASASPAHEARDDEPVGRDAAVDEEVRCSESIVAGSIPRYPSTAGVAT